MGTYKQTFLLKVLFISIGISTCLPFMNSYSQFQPKPKIHAELLQWNSINENTNQSKSINGTELENKRKAFSMNRYKIKKGIENDLSYKRTDSNAENWTKINGPEGGSVRSFYKYFDSLYTLTDREIYIYRANKWEPMNFHEIACNSITCLYVDSTGKMLAGTDFYLVASSDRGNDWNVIGGEISGATVRDILKLDTDSLLLSTNEGIFIGTPNSYNFSKLSTELTDVLTLTFGSDKKIWAGTWDGIYKAHYPELIWTRVNIDTAYYYQILINKRGTIYSNNGFYLSKSTDDGQSWEYMNGYFTDIALEGDTDLVATNYKLILRINEVGVYWSSLESEEFLLTTFLNSNNEWFVGALGSGAYKYNTADNYYTKFSEGLQSATFRAIEILKNKSIFTITDANAYYISYDNGNTWDEKRKGWSRCTHQDEQGNLYVAEGSGLIISTDYGGTWENLNIDLEDYFINAMDVSEDGNTICVGASTGDVYISTNRGVTFSKIIERNYYFVEAIEILMDGSIIFQSDSLYYTRDNGETMNTIKDEQLYAMTIKQDGEGYIYLGGYLDRLGIYRSKDILNWTYLSSIIDDAPYTFRLDSVQNVYAIYYGGTVIKTQDKGEKWKVLTNGILNFHNWSYDLDNDGNMYLGTQDDGLYYCKISINIEKGWITRYTLSNNYPNPFNISTRIEYKVPNFSKVEIKVFDVLGNEIETLVTEFKEEGTYHTVWNAGSYSNGVYFYRIQAGTFIETKKMVLLK